MEKLTREEFIKKFGEPKNSKPYGFKAEKEKGNLKDFRVGIGQSFVQSFTAPGRFVEKQLISRLNPNGATVSPMIENAIKAENKTQEAGKMVGNIMQFLAPTGVGKTAPARATGGLVSKLLNPSVTSELAKETALTATQIDPNKETGQQVAQGAGGVAFGVGANLLLPEVFKVFQGLKKQPKTAQEMFKALDEVKTTNKTIDLPKTTFAEKYIGLQPSNKKVLEENPRKLGNYIDLTIAKNNDVRATSPVDYATQRFNQNIDEIQTRLNDTGSEIGKFRQKIATVNVPVDDIKQIETNYQNQLSKLNLEIDETGNIVQRKGKVIKASKGDVNALQSGFDNLQILKQSPNVETLIDFRNALDSNINFGKTAREVSNQVDPLLRSTRSIVADSNRKILGASEAQKLQEYSDLIKFLDDLDMSESRKSLLLKRLLSSNDSESLNIFNAIKNYTGDDLVQDAVALRVTQDFIGNNQQKGLFRQEITNSGLDVAQILTGSPLSTAGMAGRALEFVGDRIITPEKTLRKIAKQ